ncbi:aldehyde dehydrogenase family protein [Peribacillus frigoritolerans]
MEGAIKSKFTSVGQQCVCANRIYVHDEIYHKFSHKFAERSKEVLI